MNDTEPLWSGANRDRTDDLLNAIQALSQLSYGPAFGTPYQPQALERIKQKVAGRGRLRR